jgi:hypothetical protein
MVARFQDTLLPPPHLRSRVLWTGVLHSHHLDDRALTLALVSLPDCVRSKVSKEVTCPTDVGFIWVAQGQENLQGTSSGGGRQLL